MAAARARIVSGGSDIPRIEPKNVGWRRVVGERCSGASSSVRRHAARGGSRQGRQGRGCPGRTTWE